MFSSDAANEQWSVHPHPSASTSDGASLAAVPGRKRKANFSDEELETLVGNIIQHFSALYGTESLQAPPARRKQLWMKIQSRVNNFGYTDRSIDDLKHKWRDLQLEVRKKLTAKKAPGSLLAGTPYKPQLTPLEKMVASTFLQPTHDPEPEIALDPEICPPGTSKQGSGPMQATTSHPESYSDTNRQPSTRPEMEEFVGACPGVQTPHPSVIEDYSKGEEQSSSEPQIPETTASPLLRNDSLVCYASKEEDPEGVDGVEGPDQPLKT